MLILAPRKRADPEAFRNTHARIAQLVEHNLAKVGVARIRISFLAHQKASRFGGFFRSTGKGFRGSETWEVWLVKQRLFGVFDAADRISLLPGPSRYNLCTPCQDDN